MAVIVIVAGVMVVFFVVVVVVSAESECLHVFFLNFTSNFPPCLFYFVGNKWKRGGLTWSEVDFFFFCMFSFGSGHTEAPLMLRANATAGSRPRPECLRGRGVGSVRGECYPKHQSLFV